MVGSREAGIESLWDQESVGLGVGELGILKNWNSRRLEGCGIEIWTYLN